MLQDPQQHIVPVIVQAQLQLSRVIFHIVESNATSGNHSRIQLFQLFLPLDSAKD